MSDVAIRVANLGKRFRIAHRSTFSGMHELLEDVVKSPLRGAMSLVAGVPEPAGDPNLADGADNLWVLRDVSFEMARGEVVGLVGRNGAGKSVLLKILSRITKPTEGRAELHGRAGSMLEVGTGFHWELTGRENVYLNGTILGMKRAEIVRKFDEIVAFSEVEKFLDTPVKHYSSGMRVRLAFAVTAHLDADILLLDEVLAVGDDAFQEKCRGKIAEVAKEGRTVLFVSHDMSAVETLCERTLFLWNGRLEMDGETDAVVARYHEAVRSQSEQGTL